MNAPAAPAPVTVSEQDMLMLVNMLKDLYKKYEEELTKQTTENALIRALEEVKAERQSTPVEVTPAVQ
jgi:hypothetical protein